MDKQDRSDLGRPIGRARELEQIGEILARRVPALIVVTGRVGVGKSTVLRMAEQLASGRGWCTLYCSREDEKCVTPETSEEEFLEHLRELMPPSRARMVEALAGEAHRLGLDLQGAVPSGSATAKEARHPVERRREWDSPAGVERLHPGVEKLRLRAQHEPVAVFIDGYRPGAPFAQWFVRRLIPDVLRSRAPIVVLMTAGTGYVEDLKGITDHIISLGWLEPETVRAHFQEILRDLDPPLGEEELVVYVKAAAQQPELIGILSRVLLLAREPARVDFAY
jgi:hypothetical protein